MSKSTTIGIDLTERERDGLQLMVEGLTNNQIVERLVVSRSTVKFQVSRILSKINVSSHAQTVIYALHNHLVK